MSWTLKFTIYRSRKSVTRAITVGVQLKEIPFHTRNTSFLKSAAIFNMKLWKNGKKWNSVNHETELGKFWNGKSVALHNTWRIFGKGPSRVVLSYRLTCTGQDPRISTLKTILLYHDYYIFYSNFRLGVFQMLKNTKLWETSF